MKIIEFKCPACGADLKADLSRKIMYCEYCGKKLILDDEALRVKLSLDNAEEAGYGFEKGRRNAYSDISKNEAKKLKRMINALPDCERLETCYGELELQNQEDEKELASLMSGRGHLPVCAALALFICFIIPDLLVIIAAISMIALMTCSS